MTRTTLKQILGVLVCALGASWLLMKVLQGQGVHLPAVTWHQVFACLVIAGLVTWGGLTVRAYIAGRKPNLSGIFASRIAVFAKASTLGGMIFAGWYGGHLLVALENIGIETQASRALWAGIAGIAAVILTVCGIIAERNCQIPPVEPENEGTEAAGSPA